MPSTYSPSLKLQLIGTGEQAGTWGTTTNYNLGTLLEQAITGVITIPMGDATYTLTNYNGLSDEARNAVLVLNGPITAPQELIAPSGQQKVYIVRNFTGNTVTIKTTSGNGVALTNAASAVVFTDGTDFYSATTLNYIDGNLTVTGNTALQNNVTLATKANATVSVYGNMYGNVNTGQWILPTGTSSQRLANGVAGVFRYNSELKFYEGYSDGYWVRFLTVNQGTYSARYLVISGGAGGGGAAPTFYASGGGGAGGVLTGTFVANPGSVYTFVVGGGGAGNVNGSVSSLNGSGGSGISVAPVGGGTGGEAFGGSGVSGGSGGGAGARSTSPGSGTSGQGNAGGNGDFDGAGGGGGWGGVGGPATGGPPNRNGGPGGIGATSDITGTAVYYAGGGGGTSQDNQGAGGTGGGGTGGGGSGTVNTGGGGGGNVYNSGAGNGGSGVCILSVPTIYYSGVYTGTPTITTSGGNTILKYTASGTYTA